MDLYQLKVYTDSDGSANPASNGTQLYETGSGSNDEWYFDYQSGVLHFIGENLPSQVTSGKSIWVSGAKYSGNTLASGISDQTLYNATIDSLASPLKTADGGTGTGEQALVLDPTMASIATLRPFESNLLAKSGDSEKHQMLTEYTLQVSNEKAHGIVADLLVS